MSLNCKIFWHCSGNFNSLILYLRTFLICRCKAAIFASGLFYGCKLADWTVVYMLTTFFTDDSSHYPVAKAAAFGNMREALSAFFGMLLTFLTAKSSYFSDRKIIIYSSVYYFTGLVLLCVVSFKPFSGSSIVCIDIFNVMGVILLTVGKAGVDFSLKPFLADQFRVHALHLHLDEDSVVAKTKLWRYIAWFLTFVSSNFLLGDSSWTSVLISMSSVMGIALIFFSCGIPFYHKINQLASVEYCHPFIVLIRFVKASILNSHKVCSSSSDNVCQNDEIDQSELSPSFRNALSCRDEVAIIESSLERQVKECNIFLRMACWWIPFLGFGLLLSTGSTFFPEQGNDMSGSLLPLIMLQRLFEEGLNLLPRKWVPKPERKLTRIWAGMVISPFCIATAWWTEVFRLSVVKKEGLSDKPDKIIPMNNFILAPQFCLLGLMKGLVKDGLDEFMIDQLPDTWSWKNYVPEMNAFVIDGIGSLLSIVCICANGSLFSRSLNLSHLDEYYKRLTVFSVVNLCCLCLISIINACSTRAAKVGEESQSPVENV